MSNNEIAMQPEESYKIIRNSVLTAQSKVYTVVNSAMVQAYWEIGQEIHKACGENDRAEYGKKLLQYLSEQLTKEFGKGFTVTNLKYMRQFYRAFPIRHTLCDELSWSHYRLLMRIEDEKARKFYLEESVKSKWSVRQLEKQIGRFYYERLLASQDKDSVANEIGLPEKVEPKNIIRDPYVLEFLGLEGNTNFYEKDLEQAIIDHLQKFLLELGRGFSFVARQQKITFDGRHFFIDLVFYNYILKCFVIIDLKLGDLTHQDLGQMQMYVNYYTREMMNEGDNPPIGIVLCADKSDQVVKYTLPEDNNQIFASKYKLYLPTEEQFNKGLQVFENMGYKVKLSKNVYANTLGYSATVSEKVEDINEMFANTEVKAIICSQGGQNSNAILSYIDYELIKNNPKIIMGISDSTAILNAIYAKTGIITYHQNDVVWGLGREVSEKEVNDFKLRLVDGKNGKVEHFTKWRCLRDGIIEGILVGGNLSTLVKLLETEYCPEFNNKILFLEDYADESPLDEIDSKINILKQHKVFEKIKGLWIGYYEKDTEIAKFEDVIMNNLKEYEFPILKCNDFGHNCENVVIPIGAKVKLDATNCEVEILEKIWN